MLNGKPIILGILEERLGFLVKKLVRTSGFAPGVVNDFAKVRLIRSDHLFKDQLDQQHDLLPVRDGKVINLITGEVRRRTKEDMFTFECPVTYDPEAKEEKVYKFISDIMLDKEEHIKFLQRVFGYALTGNIDHQYMFYLYGPLAGNGKSSCESLMSGILGPRYFLKPKKEVLINMKPASEGAPSPHLIELIGKRCIWFSEVGAEEASNETNIKNLTGGDLMNGRGMRENGGQFLTRAKIFMSVNRLPTCSSDEGLARRQCVIPFNAKFVSRDKLDPVKPYLKLVDPKLKDDLYKDEACKSTFLNWLIIGAIESYKAEWEMPEFVRLATQEYKDASNPIQRFVNSLEKVSGSEVKGADLYQYYSMWRIDNEEPEYSQQKFGRDIGKSVDKKRSNGVVYIGIRIPSLTSHGVAYPATIT